MSKVTNKQIRQLLFDLGFHSRPSVHHKKCLVLEHPDSQAVLMLPANRDDQAAREPDVISLRTHLQHRGHLDDQQFDRFLEHGVLRAS